jgi:hypothetical protein
VSESVEVNTLARGTNMRFNEVRKILLSAEFDQEVFIRDANMLGKGVASGCLIAKIART